MKLTRLAFAFLILTLSGFAQAQFASTGILGTGTVRSAKGNATDVVANINIDMFAGTDADGELDITFPTDNITGDLQNGGCMRSGGTWALSLTNPLLTMGGTVASKTGSCPSGPYWVLNASDGSYSYTAAFSLTDGVIKYNCVLTTAPTSSLFVGNKKFTGTVICQ